jgi:hypothetical protein
MGYQHSDLAKMRRKELSALISGRNFAGNRGELAALNEFGTARVVLSANGESGNLPALDVCGRARPEMRRGCPFCGGAAKTEEDGSSGTSR